MAKVTSIKTPLMIYEEYLKKRGIDKDTASQCGWSLVVSKDPTKGVQSETNGTPWLVLPYHDMEGNPTGAISYRELVAPKIGWEVEGGAKPRRLSATGRNSIDYCPLNAWLNLEVDEPIYIFESILKAAVAAGNTDVWAIGLNGVWGWSNDGRLHDELSAVCHRGRTFKLVFDADVHTNQQVHRALTSFASKLTGQGCVVRWLELPEWAGKPLDKPAGFDDYVVDRGVAWATAFLQEDGIEIIAGAHPHVEELNGQYTYDMQLNRVLEIHTGLHMTIADFYNREANIFWEDGDGKSHNAAKSWMAWEGRSYIERVVYDPTRGHGLVDNVWNKYTDERPVAALKVKKDWLDILLGNLFCNTEGRVDFGKCLAWVLRHPDVRLQKLVTLFGEQGCGKTTLGMVVKKVLGGNAELVGADRITGRFNDLLPYKTFLMLEEPAKQNRMKKLELHNALQQLITGDTYQMERKHLPVITMPNIASFFISANDQDSIFITKGDRRMAPVLVSMGPDTYRGSPWWREFYKWLNGGSAGPDIMWWAEQVDLDGFDPSVCFEATILVDDIAGAGARLIDEFAYALKDKDFEPMDPPLLHEWKRGRRLYTCEELIGEARTRYRGENDVEYITPRHLGYALNNARVPRAGDKSGRVQKKVKGVVLNHRFRVLGSDTNNPCWQSNEFCTNHLDRTGFAWE